MTPHRLVQLRDATFSRRVAVVQDSVLILLQGVSSVYELALAAINSGRKISDLVDSVLTKEELDYSSVYDGQSNWKLLPSFDHPDDPMRCLVSGTGLTHKNSALSRQAMHEVTTEKPTDSMQMYQWGEEGGHPKGAKPGVQPEWFYKGTGHMLRAHGELLEVPAFANDGGEEPEVAGAYVVDEKGKPWRVGFTTGNEFSDHVMEKKNYLYLAPSKLRNCSIGPELVLTDDFSEITGTVSITRNGSELWSKEIHSGEKNMAHSLQNLEHHHFKYPGHRVPLQAHVHFYGADAFSFGQQIRLEEGDLMTVHWKDLGRALKNALLISKDSDELVTVSRA